MGERKSGGEGVLILKNVIYPESLDGPFCLGFILCFIGFFGLLNGIFISKIL